MAHVEHVLAVVPVDDVPLGRAWYSKLFGREPDNNPMPTLVEWRVTDNGWVQVTEDSERAGTGMLNLAVSDLDERIRDVREWGIETGAVVDVNQGVRLCPITDPFGNLLHLIGGFRVDY